MENLVYAYLQKLPKGKVTTYGQIAKHLGNRHLARWVGNVLHKNPNPDLYPCYKVVDRNGRLAAHYAFGGLQEQRRLLQEDGIEVIEDHVDLQTYGYK